MDKSVYIIAGSDENVYAVIRAEQSLKLNGFTIAGNGGYRALRLNPNTTFADRMKIIQQADYVCVLEGWQEHEDAKEEFTYAVSVGKLILSRGFYANY